MGWENLSTLSFSALFLDQHTAMPLSRLPALTKLTIKCGEDQVVQWEDVRFAPGGFAQLNDLELESVKLHDALYLFNQPDLMGGLVALKYTIGINRIIGYTGDPASLLECISDQAPGLRRLHIHSLRFTAQDLQSLTRLPLTRLTLRASEFIVGFELPLLSLNSDLELLHVPEVLAPVTFLADLAPRFPKLRDLQLSLVVSSLDEFGSQEPTLQELETRFPGPLNLYVYLHRTVEGNQVDEAAARSSLIR
jgi:hypothetical protein